LPRATTTSVESGELGKLQLVEASFCFPLPKFSDIRYNFDLAGGALMDAGCYAVHMIRLLGGAQADGEPEVVRADAKLRGANIDRAMRADLRFPAGHTGRLLCSMWSLDVFKISARCRRAWRTVGFQSPHREPDFGA
jgi:predicted dehydrogenase